MKRANIGAVLNFDLCDLQKVVTMNEEVAIFIFILHFVITCKMQSNGIFSSISYHFVCDDSKMLVQLTCLFKCPL
jgi:hypothetical protein